tara:strand:- start:937 stop:1779 length:843 start_codon:yes stop_codon:yes gene_type:complete
MAQLNLNKIIVSVIICTHNRSSLLKRALESVISQDFKNLEIIVVDDFSSKEHSVAIKKFDFFNLPNCKLISLPKNVGVAKATNKGFQEAKGEFIALLGDDDYWIDNQKLTKQLNLFIQDTENLLGVVGTWWREKLKGGEEIDHSFITNGNLINQALLGGGIICGSTPLIPRKIWEEVGGLDNNMRRGTDSDLFRRIILKGYQAINLKEYCVFCDSSHPLRMTTMNNIKKLKVGISNNIYILFKYKFYFLRHPYPLLLRISRIIKYSFKINLKILQKYNLL